MSKNILIIAGHPDLKNDSLANRTILEEVEKALLEVELDILSDLYPDYQIDVTAERDRLRKADVITFQYPLYWYMTPSLLNKWIERVFIRGLSHDSAGDTLREKCPATSLTTGAGGTAYNSESDTTIDDLLTSIRLAAKLTRLNYAGHTVTHGVSYSLREDANKAQEMVAKSQEHTQKLVALVDSL